MSNESKKQMEEKLEDLLQSKWEIRRLRQREREKYDNLKKRLKGKPIWTDMPGKKADDQAVEDWAMALPLPYEIKKYKAAFDETIRAAYVWQKRKLPAKLYKWKMGLLTTVALEAPDALENPDIFKKEAIALGFDFDTALHFQSITVKFGANCSKGEIEKQVAERIDEVFEKIEALKRSLKLKTQRRRESHIALHFYEKHKYEGETLDAIAERTQGKNESEIDARKRVRRLYKRAKSIVDDNWGPVKIKF